MIRYDVDTIRTEYNKQKSKVADMQFQYQSKMDNINDM